MIKQSHFWIYTLRKWKQDREEIFVLHVYSRIIYNSQDMQTTQVSIRGRMDKDVMYTHTHQFSSVHSLSRVWLFVTPWTAACQASLCITNSGSSLKLMSTESVMPSNHLILSSPSPPVLNLSQHQGLFKWVSSSHVVSKVLEFQLQHQSFQWIFRTDFL